MSEIPSMQSAADRLMLTLARALRPHAPTVTSDISERGEDIRILTLQNPHLPRWGLQFICPAEPDGQEELHGSLWFGAVEITGYLSAEEAESTIRAVLDGEITAVLHYRNEEALADHRPSARRWVFLTTPEDEDARRLEALRARLSRPVTLMERIRGTDIGIYEITLWQSSEIIRHLPQKKERKHT